MTEWQTMENAPKDDREILLCIVEPNGKKGIVIAAWSAALGHWWTDEFAIPDNEASHWMPLPELPQ